VAKEIFQALQSFNYTVHPYDENGMDVTEPTEARRFMCMPKNLMVSLVDDDDNSRITLNLGKSVHINDVMGLDQKLRALTTKYNMIFKAQQYGKQITPRDFASLASIKEDIAMQVCEGMYGTSMSSYLRLENARMIVRHNRRIDDSRIGARGRCVESVFVENSIGERSRMPTTNLMAGRAMTQHVNQGGGFADPVGQQISGMAMQYSNLSTGANAAMSEAANHVREACRGKMGKMRKTFERLSRAGSYAAEAETIVAQANLLTETNEITASRLDELRQILNGDVSDEVIECCCKALDEMQPVTESRLEEGPRPIETTDIMGLPVEKAAWSAFWQDSKLNLRRMPEFALNLKDKIDDLAYRLSQVSMVVKDDGLANLFDRVAEKLPEETDAKRQQIFRSIAIKALRAVDQTGVLAANNPVISEHLAWLESFDPDRRLTELGTLHPNDPSFDTGQFDAAADHAIANFDVATFISSPEMQDIISGRDPHSEENHLERDEVMQALEAYLRDHIDLYFPEIGGMDDVGPMASAVYDDAVTALHDKGFVVDDDAGLTEAEELTIEDILLPKHNQGDDLSGEVSVTDVIDPDDPEQHEPVDHDYINRIQQLGGIHTGSTGQSGAGW
jgi:hypothetical protein